jgi:aspartate aminotransferase
MSLLSSKILEIQPSPTLELTQRAKELRKSGQDIIMLTVGEPDFDTPDNIKQAAIQAIKNGFTKYTNVDGIIELKTAIQKKLVVDNNLEYDLDEIMSSTGAKQVIYNLFMASINPGDEVIIPAPYWVSYCDIVQIAGGVPKVINCSIESDFKLTADVLRQNITEKTKWIILNSPSNPTGSIYNENDLEMLAEVIREYPQLHVMSDDIYEHIIFSKQKFYNLAMVAPELKERIFLVNGVSKSYAMTGWRLGYGAGSKKLIKAMKIIQSQSTSNPSSISQKAALEAITGDQASVEKMRKSLQERRDFVYNMLGEIRGLECKKPEGAFYLFPKCSSLFGRKNSHGSIIDNSVDFAEYLLTQHSIAVVPGSAFGMEGHFRMSYAVSKETLVTAIQRLNIACEQLMNPIV